MRFAATSTSPSISSPPEAAASAAAASSSPSSQDPSVAALLSEVEAKAGGASATPAEGAAWSSQHATILEHVDEGYEWVADLIMKLPTIEAINHGAAALEALQPMLGVSWPAMMVGFGCCVRLATLYFTLYGERAGLRMQAAMPELVPVYKEFEKVYYDPRSPPKEVQRVGEELRAARNEVYKRHKTSNAQAMASLLASPIFGLGFFVAMRATTRIDALGSTNFLWLTTLQEADPFMVLPCVALGATVLNFELMFRKKGGVKVTGTSQNLVWICRFFAFCFLPVIVNFRAAVVLYWFGVSVTGLLQPLLMANKTFARLFSVPDSEALMRAELKGKSGVQLAKAMGVRDAKEPWEATKEALRVQFAPSGERNPNSPKVNLPAAAAGGSASAQKGGVVGRSLQNEKGDVKPPAFETLGDWYRDYIGRTRAKQQETAAPGGLDAASAASDPLGSRINMTMPRLAQVFAPEKAGRLSEQMQTQNQKELEEAQKNKTWKATKR